AHGPAGLSVGRPPPLGAGPGVPGSAGVPGLKSDGFQGSAGFEAPPGKPGNAGSPPGTPGMVGAKAPPGIDGCGKIDGNAGAGGAAAEIATKSNPSANSLARTLAASAARLFA